MLQTTDGYLWFATEGGLARFNGYAFRIFDRDSEPRLAGNDIRCLLESRSHALWIGTSSGLTRLQDGISRTYTSADGLPSDDIRSLLQGNDGTLWVLTSSGLASLAATSLTTEKMRFHNYARSDGPLGSEVNAIVEAAEGGVWAADSRGLFLVNNGSAKRILQASPATVSALTTGTGGSLYFASADGVFLLQNGSLRVLARREVLPSGGIHELLATEAALWAAGKSGVLLIQQHGHRSFYTGHSLPGDQVQTVFADRKGAIWIGTNKGLARWWNGRMQLPHEDDGPAVLSMHEDLDGDLWIGTETAGAVELKERQFEMIGRSQGLSEGFATSVAETNDGALWVGTDGGGVSRLGRQGAHNRTYASPQGLASTTVLALANGSMQGADLWIGTAAGLGHLLRGQMHLYGPAEGLSDDFVRSLLVAHDAGVWIGTRHGITMLKDGRTTTWTTAQGLGSNLIGAMAEDAAGTKWIGTLGGLSHIDDTTVTNYTVADGLPGNTVTAVSADTGLLLVGIRGKGLAEREGGRFFSFAGVHGMPPTIFTILADGHGYVWLSSERGLDRIALSELIAFRSGTMHSVLVTHYGIADGLGFLEGSDAGHPSAVRLQDGRLCFAMRRGVVIVDPSLLPASHPSPPVVIEQIMADDREVSRTELASLPPGPSHFAFSFAGINLAQPQRLQYRYQLEGFDRDWIEAGTRRTAFYTNLPPGQYSFRVSARYGDEPWSQADARVNLQLQPRFYQTAWFRLLMLCMLVALLLGLYQLRVQALRLRFNAVAGERSRLAREIHDTLAQGFVAVSVRLEILSQMLRSKQMDESRQQLDETRALVHESLSEARRSIWNLRTEGADAQTLPTRLLRTAQAAIARGVDSQVETTGVYRALLSTTEDELYRIAQEAVANALRHADASEIQIRLTYTQEELRLEVKDDGRGFNIAAVPSREEGHFGLTGLQERAAQIGVTLTLDSTPGHGTAVQVYVPLSRHEKKEQKI